MKGVFKYFSSLAVALLLAGTVQAHDGDGAAAHEDHTGPAKFVTTIVTTTAYGAVSVVHDETLNVGELAAGTLEELVAGGRCLFNSTAPEIPMCIVKTPTGMLAVAISEAADAGGIGVIFIQKITSEALLGNLAGLFKTIGHHAGPVVGAPFYIVAKGTELADRGVSFLLVSGAYGRLVILANGGLAIVDGTVDTIGNLFRLDPKAAFISVKDLLGSIPRSIFNLVFNWTNPLTKNAKKLNADIHELGQRFKNIMTPKN